MEKLLTMVVVTYGQADHKLPLFLHSCALQEDQNFKVLLIHDGKSHPHEVDDSGWKTQRVASYFEDFIDLEYLATDERYNDWGHTLRAIGLEKTTTKYLNWNNGDNYLTPLFTKLLLASAVQNELDIAFCDILHNYPNVNFDGKGPYNVLNSRLALNQIDMSNFIVKTKLAKAVGFNHRSFAADGLFIEELLKMFPAIKSGKVPSALCVHN